MKLITGFQAGRLVTRMSEIGDPSTPESQKALAKLKKLGPAVVPTILEALPSADKKLTAEYVDVLASFTDDKNLNQIVRGLADSDDKTIKATAWALSSSKRYNINRLVDLAIARHRRQQSHTRTDH